MGTNYRTLDGTPCTALRSVGKRVMGCTQIDCDGIHHYFRSLALDATLAV